MSGRIRFANQLRGVAALCVACSHLIGVFWAMPDVVSSVTATPAQGGALPGLFWFVAHPWFNLGPFGVAIFFLISGMVVPFSLEQHGGTSFVFARLLRIFPTYLVALLLEIVIIGACAQFWARPLPFSAATIASNAALIYDLVGDPSIDLVNWTLSVELKFYLLIVLLAPAIRGGGYSSVLLAAGVLLAVNALMAAGLLGSIDAAPSTISYTVSSHSACVIYMLAGTLFNFHLRRKIGTARLLGGIVWLGFCFVGSWKLGVWRGQFPIVTANYGYALALFASLYFVRDHVPRNRVLDGMAAISFPFYLIHSLIGYIVLRAAMRWGALPYEAALPATLAVLVLLATVLHRSVEQPTQRLGRRLGRLAPSRHVARLTSGR